MKIRKNILPVGLFLALLTSCSSEDGVAPVYTVGEANNAIVLNAGLSDKKPVTRAWEYDSNHGKHTAFEVGTKLRLRVDGTWTGHMEGGVSKENISQNTIATVGAKISASSDPEGTTTHNKLESYNEPLFWNDYGTADPANESTGRKDGLTIYGIAVNKAGVDAPEITITNDGKWGCSWTLPSDQTSDWSKHDLLTSNNIRLIDNVDETLKIDGRLKFDDIYDNDPSTIPSDLLEFTHAMTKVTVNLYAGAGFSSAFEEDPTVTLKDFFYEGTVDVIAETSDPDKSKEQDISMRLMPEGGAGKSSASFEALVFPGRKLTGEETILSFSADGNNFDITSAKIYAKMPVEDGGKTMLRGTNYIINITVNKTKIEVEATIKDWENVEADMDYPVINVDKTYGHEGEKFTGTFAFLRSTDIEGSYLASGNSAVVSYDNTNSKYIMTDQLYWPNHSIHYFFRGVWPNIDSKDVEDKQKGPSTSDFPAEGKSISVSNVAYKQGYYPSDLMIGFPRVSATNGDSDERCKLNEPHTDGVGNIMKGICATTGEIRMNFRYVMSQVIVNLETSKDAEGNPVANSVVFDENTKIEILDCKKDGMINFSDGSATVSGDYVTYLMNNGTESEGIKSYTKFHDAIIPQSLVDDSEEHLLKFRISVCSRDKSGNIIRDTENNILYDFYEAYISDISVREATTPGGSTFGDPKLIKAWEPGKKYTYTLTITKTEIKIIATITDWITVTGSTEIWM